MKVLANDGISKSGIRYLQNYNIDVLEKKISQEELINFINDNHVDFLLVRSETQVKKELIDSCPSIKIIGRGGVGMDNIDVKYAEKKGIYVINTPHASSKSVAELVFAHFLSISRFLHDSNRKMPIEGSTKFYSLKESYAKSIELNGKILGVIGFGHIGVETIKIGLGLGMKVLVNDLFIKKSKTVTLNFFDGQKIDFKFNIISFKELIQNSDYISFHIPKQEKYLIKKEEFELMKDGVIIANTARGGIIDENALINALESGKVKGAALDVFENEPHPKIKLLMNSKVSISPHIGGNTLETQERIGKELAVQIINWLKNFSIK